MTIDCDQYLRVISRQIDRATSDKETQAARTHAIKCEKCRLRFNSITGADRLLAKALLSKRLGEGFSGKVAERLAEAHLAETVKGTPGAIMGAAVGLAILVIVLLVLLASSPGPEIPGIGEIGKTDGGIEFAFYRSDSFRTAKVGEKLPQGAKVQARGNGGLLRLSGGRNLALRSDSVVDLSHYHDGKKAVLAEGEIYVSLLPDAAMQVDTRDAKVYGTGASYLVQFEDSGRTTVVVESGEVNFLNAAGAVKVKAGEKSELLEGSGPRKPAETNTKNYLDWVRQLGL